MLCTENLERHGSQLFRYFGTSEAKFAILTNGIIYQFYTDLDEPNKMDETSFLEVNILEIKEHEVYELKKFSKSTFEIDSIFNSASILKYENEFKHILASQLEKPNDDFVRLFLQNVYSGVKTQSVIDKFRPILKKTLNDFINETMNDKIKTALGGGDSNSTSSNSSDIDDKNSPNDSDSDSKSHTKKIVTTEDELEAYFIVKNILKDIVGMNDITYKDTESYCNILYKANIRKWICRLKITSMQKILMLPDENKKITKIPISNLYEILNYKE